ncbi:hypothetical protein BD560DRAFT_408225 [Blakeslea trispora]|nr:hypothetical protein BD560DRAFT_408225 [Blakeslea trispora]
MYTQPSFRLEAIHFAIGLAYYNLVRVPPNSVHSVELCKIQASICTFVFSFVSLFFFYK